MSRARWSEPLMRELLRVHEESGLSLKAFAAREGVPYTTLSWWRSRLRSDDEPRLLPVSVKEAPRTAVEIVVGDVIVRVGDGDETSVARLVRAIASC